MVTAPAVAHASDINQSRPCLANCRRVSGSATTTATYLPRSERVIASALPIAFWQERRLKAWDAACSLIASLIRARSAAFGSIRLAALAPSRLLVHQPGRRPANLESV